VIAPRTRFLTREQLRASLEDAEQALARARAREPRLKGERGHPRYRTRVHRNRRAQEHLSFEIEVLSRLLEA
jgi:hypothetical protein